jgi:hypothetical protein
VESVLGRPITLKALRIGRRAQFGSEIAGTSSFRKQRAIQISWQACTLDGQLVESQPDAICYLTSNLYYEEELS